MVTTGDIYISAVAQTRPDRELVAPEMFGSFALGKVCSWPKADLVERDRDVRF